MDMKAEATALLQMRVPGMVYLSGPMTGLPAFNYPAFHAAAAKLRAEGHQVINPAEYGGVEGATWADYLRYDIALLMRCDAIALLPGWSDSKGARLEKFLADQLGLSAIYLPGAEVGGGLADDHLVAAGFVVRWASRLGWHKVGEA